MTTPSCGSPAGGWPAPRRPCAIAARSTASVEVSSRSPRSARRRPASAALIEGETISVALLADEPLAGGRSLRLTFDGVSADVGRSPATVGAGGSAARDARGWSRRARASAAIDAAGEQRSARADARVGRRRSRARGRRGRARRRAARDGVDEDGAPDHRAARRHRRRAARRGRRPGRARHRARVDGADRPRRAAA